MLESINMTGDLEYKKLSPEECEKRGILGRLVGKIASWKDATRNGRKYTEDLWEGVFNSPLMQEKIKNKVCLGELGHPESRSEIDMEKVAVCLAEQPKKGKDGFLYGILDILNTPNGKILKALCDYGCQVGISSRGQGEVITDYDGNESVDPETYECECFDVVLIPAVKEARLKYVTESLNRKPLKESLQKLVESANEEDKKVMEETIKELNLVDEEETPLKIEEEPKKENVDNVQDGIVKDLQEALRQNTESQKKIIDLQEQLSVGNAKEQQLVEKLDNYRKFTEKLSKSLKDYSSLKDEVEQLKESLKLKDEEVDEQKQRVGRIQNRLSNEREENRQLKEQLEYTEKSQKVQDRKIRRINETYQRNLQDKETEKQTLQENLEELKKDIEIKEKQNIKKLSESMQLVEKYKNTAKRAIQKYIDLQATQIGVRPDEIKNKLGESYTFEDIDRICEDLKTYKINVNRLPFNVQSKATKIEYSKAKKETMVENLNKDDSIDNDLMSLAGV